MQNLVRSKTIGVTGNGGRGTAGPVLVATFFTKCFLLFVLGREGGGVRANYTR